MVNDRTHSSEIHDRCGDPWPADPTPKPTAEEFTRHVCSVANPCCLDEAVEFAAARKNVLPLIVRRDSLIRRKAFEEAAEVKPDRPTKPGQLYGLGWDLGWDAGVEAHADAIRALAKEQADEHEDKSPRPLGEREVRPRMLGDLDPGDGSW